MGVVTHQLGNPGGSSAPPDPMTMMTRTVNDVVQQVLVVMRRPTKSHGANGHARSSSLSNGRDRLSLYAPSPSLCEEAAGGGGGEPRSRADELHDLMSHSLTLGLGGSTSASSSSASASGNNSNDRLIRNRKPLAQKSAEKKARKVP